MGVPCSQCLPRTWEYALVTAQGTCCGVQLLPQPAMPAASYPQSCPVVLVTGQGREQIAVQALHGGVQDYLVQGDLSTDLLYRTITHAIDKFRLHWSTLVDETLSCR
jgi:DNA-binding NtrC family response regulator